MPVEKKKPEPEFKIREVYDAKATADLGKLIVWAPRDGAEKIGRVTLTRKQETATPEPAFSFDPSELPSIIALLTRFRDHTLPALTTYGVSQDEE